MSSKHSAGKGDSYRKINYEVWSKNWDLIFNKKKKQLDNKSNKNPQNPLDKTKK